MRPQGYLLATVLGEMHQSKMLNGEGKVELSKKGSLELNWDHPNASYSTYMTRGVDVFQTQKEILDSFSQHFTIHRIIPIGLDLIIMQKI